MFARLAAVTLLAILGEPVLAQTRIIAVSDQVAGASPFAGHSLYGHRSGDPNLREWVFVTIDATASGPAVVLIDDGTEQVSTNVSLNVGSNSYVAYGRMRWPAAPTNAGVATLVVNSQIISTVPNVTLGSRRPWTCHLVSETCDDDVWGFDRKADEVTASAALTTAELDSMDQDDQAGYLDFLRNRYHPLHYRAIEDLLTVDPLQAQRVFPRIAQGRLELGMFPGSPLGTALSSAEIVQWFLPFRAYETMAPGAQITGVHYQETPALPWGLATVLAQSGALGICFSPFVLVFYPAEGSPIEYWEGPDGSRLFWRHSIGYAEASGLNYTQLLDKVRTIYEPYGTPTYPWSHYIAFGIHADMGWYSYLRAGASGLIARQAWNALQSNHPGAEFPRIESSTHTRFFQALDLQRTQHPGIDAGIPVRRGDFGAEWEAWTLGLQAYAQAWREAMALLPAADALTATAERFFPGHFVQVSPRLKLAHRETGRLSDHAWNGSTPANQTLSANLRQGWGATAVREARWVIDQGLARLSAVIGTTANPRVVVFNKESFAAPGGVALDLTAAGLGAGPFRAVDGATGAEHPCQTHTDAGASILTIEAGVVPSFGWRVFELVPGAPAQVSNPVWVQQNSANSVVMENGRYHLLVDPTRHQVPSLVDKALAFRETLVPGRPLGLCADGATVAPAFTNGLVSAIRRGPAYAEVEMTGSIGLVTYTTRIRLYANLPGIEWEVRVQGPLAQDFSPLFHAGVQAQGRTTYLQGPCAVFRPGYQPNGDQVPRTTVDYHVIDRFIDFTGSDAGMAIAPSDSMVAFVDGLSSIQRNQPGSAAFPLFGRGWGSYPSEKLPDQNGETQLRFRFALLPHGPGFDPSACYRFASTTGRHAFLSRVIPALNPGNNVSLFSACAVEPSGVVATSLAVSGEGPSRGLTLQVWDVGSGQGSPFSITADLDGLGGVQSGNRTDPLQRDLSGARNDFAIAAGRGAFALRPKGIGAIRFQPGLTVVPPSPVIQSVQPTSLVNFAPGRLLTISGPEVGTAVAVQIGTSWYRELNALSRTRIEVLAERIEGAGNVPVRVLGASGSSAPFSVQVHPPTPPVLQVDPERADVGRPIRFEAGAEPFSASFFFISAVNAPFVVPGLVTFGIGGPTGSIVYLSGALADADGTATLDVVNPGIGGGGATIFVQAISFFAGPLSPSNVRPMFLQ